MKEFIMFSFLGFNSWTDIRKKEIHLPSVLILMAVGLFGRVINRTWDMTFVLSVFMTLFVLLLSVAAKGKIGMGDGLLLWALVLCMDSIRFFRMVILGVFAAALFGGFLIFVRKKDVQTEMPFIPFLLLGYTGGMFLC